MLLAREYDLKVTSADAGSHCRHRGQGVTVPAGANIAVVAHLSADGKPVLSPYVNGISKVAAGKARLTSGTTRRTRP
ncbi:MAG: hypothetical protein H7270_11400 [Dermatophilaceae bacterium]|nr:hypothetical protein [Dermatophilaceae bacterium]